MHFSKNFSTFAMQKFLKTSDFGLGRSYLGLKFTSQNCTIEACIYKVREIFTSQKLQIIRQLL